MQNLASVLHQYATSINQAAGNQAPQVSTRPSNVNVDVTGILRNALQQGNRTTGSVLAPQASTAPPAVSHGPQEVSIPQLQQFLAARAHPNVQNSSPQQQQQSAQALLSALLPLLPAVQAQQQQQQQRQQEQQRQKQITQQLLQQLVSIQQQKQQKPQAPQMAPSALDRLREAIHISDSFHKQAPSVSVPATNAENTRTQATPSVTNVSTSLPPTSPTPAVSSVDMDLDLASHTIPSQRESFRMNHECKTSLDASKTLTMLGSTLRSKSDPFIDASVIPDPDIGMGSKNRESSNLFPDKLYRMLQKLEENGQSDIASFLPHGRAFKVHKMERFVADILPKYFSGQKRWCSFIRQCQLYGFIRVTSGRDSGAYYHELFLNGHPNLCRYMKRVGAPKGLDRRRYKLPSGSDPNFDAMRPLAVVIHDCGDQSDTQECPSITAISQSD